MKKQVKSLLLAVLFVGMSLPVWGQATPSTEGKDFWVTFLRACSDSNQKGPTELKLTFSAREACDVTIENANASYSKTVSIPGNSSTEFVIPKANWGTCYNDETEAEKQNNYTALHVTATKDISLFAGNYRDKSFDAANVLPTAALLDDYLVQTYPPSDHENNPQGSHFAIVAVEDGETTIDYTLTAKSTKTNIGTYNVTLKKGQVWYVWTGKNAGDAADLSGSTVKARNGKKIAVFQGCSHTNVPDLVRDRDHLFSQAMPTAYWGSEFGITASRKHRRDIVAVMALNDGTEVYINSADGEPVKVHTFDFSRDLKRYWTFEIGEYLAYCADDEAPSYGQLDPPLVVDSSCYITTSCPVGVHLFMVSNRYDNVTEKVKSDTLVDDPAMLWISPIEQVIKEINFATYSTKLAKFHFMNIVTPTSSIGDMKWNGQSIAQHFSRLRGKPEYSFARIEIQAGNHNLQNTTAGFLAHVYGYGERESYAYSCGSSTVVRSATFNGLSVKQDSVLSALFCVNQDIEMKLDIHATDFDFIEWDFGDGVSYIPSDELPVSEKTTVHHTYSTPGWYDVEVTAKFRDACTGKTYGEGDPMRFTFRVVRADTIAVAPTQECLSLQAQKDTIAAKGQAYLDNLVANGQKTILNPDDPCYVDKQMSLTVYGLETEETLDTIVGRDRAQGYDGRWYTRSQDVTDTTYTDMGCINTRHWYVKVLTCLDLSIPNDAANQHACPGENFDMSFTLTKGDIAVGSDGQNATFKVSGQPDKRFTISNTDLTFEVPVSDIKKPGYYSGQIEIKDQWCGDTKTFPVDFAIYYPDNIFKYKFNNVCAIYKKGNGGNTNYEFSHYEWHLIRGGEDIIVGEDKDVLYLGKNVTFQDGDGVYVILTDNNGMVLPSCVYTIDEVADYNVDPNKAPATKHLINSNIIIRKGEQTYNIYGQRVE